ncbi:MAG: NAD(P)-dependent oxidoreductase [Lactimicrobium sp.]|jgi:nucleoside-diphosphate-sugar epimerase|uniref:NAD-dependent epimerase/dehydratase family protein n=1 Tax=Lactimicrobium sp. TaxID=2563780 RepID=UPI002F3579BD
MRVLVTGAAGTMGYETIRQMADDQCTYDVRVTDLPGKKSEERLGCFVNKQRFEVVYGDLTKYEDALKLVKDCDLILHIAAFVSPAADYYPKRAMQVNYGGTRNLIKAIFELHQENVTRFVYIDTVAETGDRLPPIHWGRVGDPIKPSMFDYYAVTKVASERMVIESGLKYWASLRQTGMMGPAMAKVRDAIQFHNCLANVLEYVSDRDSGRCMDHIAVYLEQKKLPASFWNHIYNIGGGEKCRLATVDLYRQMYGRLGFTSLDDIIDPKLNATRNFHGQYYLDSDKLENYLHFRHDDMTYFYDAFLKEVGAGVPVLRAMNRLPHGQKLAGDIMKKFVFAPLMNSEHGTKHWLDEDMQDHINAYWGSKAAWQRIPDKVSQIHFQEDLSKVVPIDHGYDETKPESELNLSDMQKAAEFRVGKCLSSEMETGRWDQKLTFRCAFGHTFKASPRLILEGGHWCPECEKKSWNYGNRAKVDPFFAQVWNPLHDLDETREYPKEVSEDDMQ